ncbi:hypothetical protein [Coxiella endosymbiont of Ornithodoros maritimus]|nr:hypothetical protein [Coxiella endosymbiont of Ornithodoros maritimus]
MFRLDGEAPPALKTVDLILSAAVQSNRLQEVLAVLFQINLPF